jgi:hypothetical protein
VLDVCLLRADYLSKTELIYLCFLTYYLNTTTLRLSCPHLLIELLVQLPEKIEQATYLRMQERIELWKLFSRLKIYFNHNWPLHPREVMGILSDPEVAKKVRTRLYQKVRLTRSRARRPQRHRGYRDHGTLRPSHKWLPKFDYSLTELQQELERERAYLKRYYQLAITGRNPVAVEDYPTIFDL